MKPKPYPCGKCGRILQPIPGSSLNPAYCPTCKAGIDTVLQFIRENKGKLSDDVKRLVHEHKSDGKIHIRKRPEAAAIEPAWCGRILESTITDAFGYWGPGGDGYAEVCKECEKAKAGK